MPSPRVIACIPAYNEERNIASVIVQLKNYVNEIIVCDDGSTDLTYEIATNLGATVIKHEQNEGYGAALITTLNYAKQTDNDIVVTIDADRQHHAEDIEKLVSVLSETDADIVIGSRFLGNTNTVPQYRKIGIDIITQVSTKNDKNITDSQSGFRAYTKKALEQIDYTEKGMGLSTEILIKALQNGLKIIEVPISVSYYADSSTHNPILHGLRVLATSFKHISLQRPLLYYGGSGILLVFLSFYLWGRIFFYYNTLNVLNIQYIMVSITLTIIGVVLISTGIILGVFESYIKKPQTNNTN